jgi:PhnB protein
MLEKSLASRVDAAVEEILKAPGALAPAGARDVRPLAVLAASLAGLPRERFRKRLKASLASPKGARPSVTRAAAALPASAREGFHSLTPYLTVPRPADFSAFLQQAFGAVEHFRSPGSAGGMHIELSIRDSMLMVGGFADRRPDQESPCALHLYVEDADAVYERALAAGATSLHAPVDQFYGDREAAVSDGFGNQWFIATHKAGDTFVRPGRRAITPSLLPVGAGACLDYLKRAFGAEELESHAPGGIVRYAAARIGDSVVELGEAHGQWQPMPSALYLYVSDADALYTSALAAGGTSLLPPTDQDYGDRNAWVKDPFGHTWYIATPSLRAARPARLRRRRGGSP